jgi:hypothetical protein
MRYIFLKQVFLKRLNYHFEGSGTYCNDTSSEICGQSVIAAGLSKSLHLVAHWYLPVRHCSTHICNSPSRCAMGLIKQQRNNTSSASSLEALPVCLTQRFLNVQNNNLINEKQRVFFAVWTEFLHRIALLLTGDSCFGDITITSHLWR